LKSAQLPVAFTVQPPWGKRSKRGHESQGADLLGRCDGDVVVRPRKVETREEAGLLRVEAS
jgi:hypothetical protein